MKGKPPILRDAIIEAVRFHGRGATIAYVTKRSGLPRRNVTVVICRMARYGWLIKDESKPAKYRLGAVKAEQMEVKAAKSRIGVPVLPVKAKPVPIVFAKPKVEQPKKRGPAYLPGPAAKAPGFRHVVYPSMKPALRTNTFSMY